MPSNHGTGFLASGETHYVRGPRAAFRKDRPPVPLAIYLSGAGMTAHQDIADVQESAIIRRLATRFLVLVSDWGGVNTFGNDTNQARIDAGIAIARSTAQFNLTSDAPVFVGLSMGAQEALVYAKANGPSKVRGIAGVVPGMDITDVVNNNRGGNAAGINAAYGGAWNPATHGPTKNPVTFASTISTSIPIKLWTSNNDTVVLPSTVSAFLTARPSTQRVDMGAKGHGTTSVAGYENEVADWCISLLG